MVANDFLKMNLTEMSFADVMYVLEEAGCERGELIDNYGNSAIEVELDFDNEDDSYACVHIFPEDYVVEDDEEFDYFHDCLVFEDWDCAETDYVKRFYVLVMDANGRTVLGYENFGITQEEFDSLQYRDQSYG